MQIFLVSPLNITGTHAKHKEILFKQKIASTNLSNLL